MRLTKAELARVAALRGRRPTGYLQDACAAWRAMPEDVRAVALRDAWPLGRVVAWQRGNRARAGAVLPAPRLRGVVVDERMLTMPEVRAVMVQRLRRLFASRGVLWTGEARLLWIAGALSAATGEIIGPEDAAELSRSL